jgi:hypothetical protein
MTLMEKVTKKEIRQSVEENLSQVVTGFNIEKPSKKTLKIIERFSKRFAAEITQSLKRSAKDKAAAERKTTRKTKKAITKGVKMIE